MDAGTAARAANKVVLMTTTPQPACENSATPNHRSRSSQSSLGFGYRGSIAQAHEIPQRARKIFHVWGMLGDGIFEGIDVPSCLHHVVGKVGIREGSARLPGVVVWS